MSAKNPDWENGSSVLDCNRYMLDNQVSCDVTFEIHKTGHSVEKIGAHKYMLVSRCEYFHDMFCEEPVEISDVIEVYDMDMETIRDIVLPYIYYENFEPSAATLPKQLFASEVYSLTCLRDQCETWMRDNIDEKTACTIWECAITYQHPEVDTRARQFVLDHATEVLNSGSFLKVGANLLHELLASDELVAKEEDVFEACLSWAREECLIKGLKAEGQTVRETLGKCLFLIRFPLMNANKFVEIMDSNPDVLTKTEENSLLKYFITGKAEDSLTFRTTPRKWKQLTAPIRVQRYGSVRTETWACSDGNKDAICFMCDKAIVLKGVTVYGSPDQTTHKLQVDIMEGGGPKPSQLYSKLTESFKSPGKSDCLELLLEKDIPLAPNKKYTVVQRMWGRDVYRGLEGKSCVVAGGATFNFSGSPLSQNGTNVKYGQMPGLLFQLP